MTPCFASSLQLAKELAIPKFEILKFFEQKFCKTEISNLGMAITITMAI
jgi:hypothetical protein